MKLGVLAFTAVGALALSGCSQVVGLAVQGNMNVIYLSSSSTDVLLDKGYKLKQKPVCTVANSKDYSCTGSTVDGQQIAVTVPDSTVEDPQMIITVGSTQIFSGSVIQVIEQNAEAQP